MARQASIAQAKNQLPALVHAVEAGQPVELTRRGRPVAVLVSLADYARISPARPTPWAAIARFRAAADLSLLEDVDAIFAGVRDSSPGRDVEL